MFDEDWDILDREALSSIHLFLVQSMEFNISMEKTMEYLMLTLTKLYEKPSMSNTVFLIKCLFNLNEFNMITIQLNSLNVNFDEEVRALLFLYYFPKI
jgi:hypothetical protein